MAGVSSDPSALLIVGVNHRTGGLSLRDRLFIEDAAVPAFLDRLRGDGIGQALVVSTCDRIEIGCLSDAPARDTEIIRQALAVHAGLTPPDVAAAGFSVHGEPALRHLFRVASSLESVIVGEPQVLGQLKACHRMARDTGMLGGDLETVLQAAYGAAKRVRTETAIGERPVSIAAVAVGIARDVHGDLRGARALILGAGDMGELIGRELQRAGLARLAVADVGPISTASLAAGMGADHVPAGGLAEALAGADIIVSAVGGRGQPLSADMVRAALKARRFKPQFIVDASLPSDVEPAVDRLEDAFLYDLGDLERLALEGQSSRRTAADAAASIVDAEVAAFLRGRQERSATPALNALRGHVAALRDEVLAEAGNDAERATHLMMQRLLHTPSVRLREMAAQGADVAALERTLRQLFDIEGNGDDKP